MRHTLISCVEELFLFSVLVFNMSLCFASAFVGRNSMANWQMLSQLTLLIKEVKQNHDVTILSVIINPERDQRRSN